MAIRLLCEVDPVPWAEDLVLDKQPEVPQKTRLGVTIFVEQLWVLQVFLSGKRSHSPTRTGFDLALFVFGGLVFCFFHGRVCLIGSCILWVKMF